MAGRYTVATPIYVHWLEGRIAELRAVVDETLFAEQLETMQDLNAHAIVGRLREERDEWRERAWKAENEAAKK